MITEEKGRETNEKVTRETILTPADGMKMLFLSFAMFLAATAALVGGILYYNGGSGGGFVLALGILVFVVLLLLGVIKKDFIG